VKSFRFEKLRIAIGDKNMLILLLVYLSCNNENKIEEDPITEVNLDMDGDGFETPIDCDDSNASINPSAVEICDGNDNNCDGEVDEGVLNTYYLDADEDGFGDNNHTLLACRLPDGYVQVANDCDDSDPDKYPGSTTLCDTWRQLTCSGGGAVSGDNFRGAFCQSPLDIASGHVSSGNRFIWQPGSFATISP